MRTSTIILIAAVLAVGGIASMALLGGAEPLVSVACPATVGESIVKMSLSEVSSMVLPEPVFHDPIPLGNVVSGSEERVDHLAELEQSNVALQAEIAELKRQLLCMEYPEYGEDTPFGAFLRSSDALSPTFATREARNWIQAKLDDLPVYLRPGEAEFLWSESSGQNWRKWHFEDPLEAQVRILAFLNHDVYSELSPEKVEWLLEYQNMGG